MGMVYANIRVGNPHGGDMVPLADVLVDTGASHSMLPAQLLTDLQIEPQYNVKVSLAENDERWLHRGEARFLLMDNAWTCPVYFSTEGEYLIGATTLEAFDLMVDPVEGQLVRRAYRARSI